MKNILKKLLVTSLIVGPMLISNHNEAWAYDEELQKIDSRTRILNTYQTPKTDINKFTVVIDAGHGGKDSGAVNKNLNVLEKSLNLDLAKVVENKLKTYGINVVMTRTEDKFIELPSRPALANAINADLFVSLHNDTADGNGDGSHIIHSVFDRNGGISKSVATTIGNSIKSNTSQNLKKDRAIWSRFFPNKNNLDYYCVIREAKMPSIIIEHSFMNNNDIKAVDTHEKRVVMGEAVADGIYKAINEHFRGWVKDKGYWKYYDKNTHIQKMGWINENSEWYYLGQNGRMKTGWAKISDKWYYFNQVGKMQTGWIKTSNKWYYFMPSGEMKTNWLSQGDKWYYFMPSGEMKINWLSQGDKWYYFMPSGEMKTRWLRQGNDWYYFMPSGQMKTGWLIQDEKWYHLNSNGQMETGKVEVSNIIYDFGQDGIMKEEKN
ncbi:N-acetylmuramoyl-L-alanine amidase [Romboutsia maritimum]|uniref:N-acetylmuramoyl-L-alanine amidase n=1 Tax=Romboutsia maritimum TaxID=2020948 RepID=A0A371IWZ6_9FIRM|nr:N-acetylmuramoyl-L-alanine amidase [Romboutsia maritimum]RDY25006.1 N-acetylmuramoyl-L-alanine amidase [Romboutsia maritimum]